ncbi:hypothetical protein [Thalassobacillus hwangdonensis]|uniref:Pilus assembly protein PilO n=1 Tax=Thalassobacillus hwangdonensis TaxID=546108 RepID=A0ABW3KZD4_9BACI
MKLQWNKNTALITALLIVVLIAGIYFGHLLVISPLEEKVVHTEAALETELKILDAMEKNTEVAVVEEVHSSRVFQQKLPVIPMLDQLFIGFDRAENSSDSFIEDIGIEYGAGTVVFAGTEADEVDEVETENPDQNDTEAMVTTEPPPEQTFAIDGLRNVTFTMNMISKDFEGMRNFLTQLQSLPRIIQIEAITFEEPADDELNYSLTLSSYYMEGLDILKNEAPHYYYGMPSDKSDPFSYETLILPENEEGEIRQ